MKVKSKTIQHQGRDIAIKLYKYSVTVQSRPRLTSSIKYPDKASARLAFNHPEKYLKQYYL
jgi:hypothetical protein